MVIIVLTTYRDQGSLEAKSTNEGVTPNCDGFAPSLYMFRDTDGRWVVVSVVHGRMLRWYAGGT